MTLGLIILANAIMAIGASVQTVTGFGMNLLVLPIMLCVAPSLVPGPLLLCQLLLVLGLSSMNRKEIDRRTLRVACAAATGGTALGLFMLHRIGPSLPALLTGVVLVAISIMSVCKGKLRLNGVSVAVAGFLCGLCGTTSAVSGPPLVAVMASERRMATVRATLPRFLLFSTMLSLAGLFTIGKLASSDLLRFVSVSPGVVVGILGGRHFSASIDRLVRPSMLFTVSSCVATLIFVGKTMLR